MYSLSHWFFKITGFPAPLFIFRTKVYYEDKKVQGRRIKGKAIVMPNHQSIMDFAVMMFVFWTRTLRCLMAEVLYSKNFIMTLLLKLLGGIKVNRNTHDFSFLSKAEKILDKGGVVEIYPESRLALPDEEKPLEFKPSVAYMALQSGAPVIPVYTDGQYFNNKRARVIIGTPIDVREWYDEKLSEKENLDAICKRLREKVIDLKDELQRQMQNEKEKKNV
ncbi:MAG: lysophospholipid acyltransferase family protein [Candidatus Coproplasma sp.]